MEPREGLFEEIMGCIRKKRLFYAKCRMAAFFLLFVGSATAFLPVLRIAAVEFSESGFLEFISLLVSDSGVILVSWQNFLLALAESLPAVSLAMLLTVAMIFLRSFQIISKDLKFVYGYK